jgi:hypothetical protein
MPRRTPKALLIAGLAGLALLITPAAHARQDTATVGHDIIVREGETSGDIACAFCNVRVHGDVHGDIAIAFGNLTVDSGHEVTGDVAVLHGDVALRDNTRIGGDAAIIGTLHEDDGATITGSRSVVSIWLWPFIPLAPLLILAGIIWLIVHLIRRNRYRPMYPPYPPIRRY